MGSFPSGIRHDYKDAPPAAAAKRLPHWPWLAAGVTMPLIAAVVLTLVSTGSETAAVPEIDDLSGAADPVVFANTPQTGFEPGISDRELSGTRFV